MNKYVIGVDPDSEAHGIAIYCDGVLTSLSNWTLLEVLDYLEAFNMNSGNSKQDNNELLFVVENVLNNKFIYARNDNGRKRITNHIAISVGRVQQAQMELQRVFDCYNVPYILVNPHSGNWANDRELFKRVTKWNGKSNADTRSAAYFGYLYIDEKKGIEKNEKS